VSHSHKTLPLSEGGALADLRHFTLDGEQCMDVLQPETSQPTMLTLQSTETSDGEVLVFNVPDIVDPSLIDSSGSYETSTVFTTTFNTIGLSASSKSGRSGTSEVVFDESGTRTVVSVNVGDFSGGKGQREIRVASVGVLDSPARGGSAGDEGSFEEGFDELREYTVRQSTSSEQEGTDFGVATERKTAETEQLMAAEVEEKKTFTIQAVVNPADGSEIPMQKAIMLGILRPNEGLYVNTVTGERKPIPVAMNEGLIKVLFTWTTGSLLTYIHTY